jgi:hypothetical protein
MLKAVAARGVADQIVLLPEVAGAIRQMLALPAHVEQRAAV